MSEQRDELAGIIAGTVHGPSTGTDLTRSMADAVLAAGYRKPRTVTTVEELDKLADGSAVVDRYGDVSTKHAHWWHGYETSPLLPSKVVKFGPLTVIYEPEPQP